MGCFVLVGSGSVMAGGLVSTGIFVDVLGWVIAWPVLENAEHVAADDFRHARVPVRRGDRAVVFRIGGVVQRDGA